MVWYSSIYQSSIDYTVAAYGGELEASRMTLESHADLVGWTSVCRISDWR